jgi:PAS domain S-box-containing protein
MRAEQAAAGATAIPAWAAPPRSTFGRVWAVLALSVAYIALYVALDRLSFIEAQHGINITPWSPSAGLALALLIIKGPRWFPAVFAAELLSSATLPEVAVPSAPIFISAFVVTGGYAGTTIVLRRIGFEAGLRRTSDVARLILVTIASSGLVACAYVATYAAVGIVPWTGFLDAVQHYWIGDAIGIIGLAPPLLTLARPKAYSEPADYNRRWLQLSEIVAQGASIAVALALVFSRVVTRHPFRLFYVLFLPLIWIAIRRGLAATSWAVLGVQVGLVVGLQLQDQSEPTLRDFQLLMFALAATGLLLGAVVSERQRLSRALAESEHRRTIILNTARDGILSIDAYGQIQSTNPAVERIFARPGHLLVGLDIQELIDNAPNEPPLINRIVTSRSTGVTTWELDARRVDGQVFPIELSVGRSEAADVEQYTLVIRDITLRRKTEARARQHQDEMARVSRISLAGEMAGAMAHELSQPLTAIAAFARGCLRLLRAPTPEPESLYEGVSEVVQQAERAGDVLGRLREFMSGGGSRRAFVAVGPLIDAAVGLACVEAMQNEVEIEARVDPGLPPVLADHVQIEQVLLNLLRNGIDAIATADSQERLIVVEAQCKSGHMVQISVADSGPGVPAEVANRLFEPFVTTKPEGMGMGLSISRSIIESHGEDCGCLTVSSPVRPSCLTCRRTDTNPAAMPDRTVFIVDDDAAVRQGLRFLLRSAGYTVEAFPSALSFLEDYDPRRGGCLLLDVQMPRMTGVELQQQLNVRGWRIPVIFITGHGTVTLAVAAIKAGAFDFVEKPLREDVLLECIEQALNWNDTAREERLESAQLQARAALLTEREREVLDLVAGGEPNKVIARHLGISFRTVELHRAHIIEKLQARSSSDLIRMAIILKARPNNSNN